MEKIETSGFIDPPLSYCFILVKVPKGRGKAKRRGKIGSLPPPLCLRHLQASTSPVAISFSAGTRASSEFRFIFFFPPLSYSFLIEL